MVYRINKGKNRQSVITADTRPTLILNFASKLFLSLSVSLPFHHFVGLYLLLIMRISKRFWKYLPKIIWINLQIVQ